MKFTKTELKEMIAKTLKEGLAAVREVKPFDLDRPVDRQGPSNVAPEDQDSLWLQNTIRGLKHLLAKIPKTPSEDVPRRHLEDAIQALNRAFVTGLARSETHGKR